MRSFMYTIKVPVGMHARHAGLLVQAAKPFESDVRLYKGEKGVDAKRILGLMGLGVRQGDAVRITADGPDEDEAIVRLKAFMWENF